MRKFYYRIFYLIVYLEKYLLISWVKENYNLLYEI